VKAPSPLRGEGWGGGVKEAQMSCYFRHMKDVFDEAGLEVTKENRKDVDRKVHEIAGVPYKDCPATGRRVKEMMGDAAGRKKLVRELAKMK